MNFFFSLHTGIRPSESPKHYGDEKDQKKTLNVYITSNLHAARTEKDRIVKKPYITGLDIQLHAMNSFHV